MVEVFLVHPDLNITDCSDYSSMNLRQYQTKYVRAINEYENLIHNIIDLKKGFNHNDSASIQSLTKNLADTSLDDSVLSICGDKEFLTRIPRLPDYDLELQSMSGVLSDLEKTLLDYYKTRLEFELLGLNYAELYCLMNKTMREIFSKLELSIEEEEEGIKLISKYTESIKSMEKKVTSIKSHKQELEAELVNDYGLLSYQDQQALSPNKRKGSGNLTSINEEDAMA